MISNPSSLHFCPILPSSPPYYSGTVRSASSLWAEQGQLASWPAGQGWQTEEELSRALHCSVLV